MKRCIALLTCPTLVVVALALGSGPSPAASWPAADGPPALVGFTYLEGPFARVGWTSVPVARVVLDAPAQGDTTVTITSSDETVAVVPGSVTVPTGSTVAQVPVTGVSEGTVTLFAQLGVTVLSPAQQLQVGGPARAPVVDSLELTPMTVAPGGTATAVVSLDFLAPPGGAQLAVASSDPQATVPPTVTVLEDDYQATFQVSAPTHAGTVSVTATLGDHSESAVLTVVAPTTPGPGPGPAPDTTAPDTQITKARIRQAAHRATFRFESTEAATFECRLDGKAFRPCTSPQGYRQLAPGRHVFRVRSLDASGNVDATPDRKGFRITG